MPQKANSSSYTESHSPFRIADSWRTQLPIHTTAELERYVNRGPAGLSGFLYRLLSGDAFGAARVADDENRASIGAMLTMIAQDFPGDSFGSPEAVEFWKGLRHGQISEPIAVPPSWTLTVEELRREGPEAPITNRSELN